MLGSPIAHSLSPVLHRAAYAALGLDWRYDRVEVDAAGLPGFLAGLDESWVGLSLTMPLKHAVLPLCARLSPLARTVGAVNTVLFAPDRSRTGDNTDVPGLVAALGSAGLTGVPDRVTVLGGGATATSAVAAVARLPGGGQPVEVYVRDPRRAAEVRAVADGVGIAVSVREWPDLADGLRADLVISTVPAAGSAAIAAVVPERVGGLLFDVAYDPWPTELAAAWRSAGGEAAGGLGLLVHQAALQVELMTGRPGVAGQLVPVMDRAARRASSA